VSGPTPLRELLAGPTVEAARALSGAHLIAERRPGSAGSAGPATSPGRRAGRIVEVEAYIGEEDQASHARFGRTARNAVMYGPPGFAYVYLIYGMHQCLNVVTEPEGRPAAVLIRAVEPLDAPSAEAIRDSRWLSWRQRLKAPDDHAEAVERARLASVPDARVARGPGLVTAAFGLTRSDTGRDLLDPGEVVRIEAGSPPARVEVSPRIGIGYAAEPWQSLPWRFFDPDSAAVSGARPRGSAS
jgi:DNA-3-methyladenine glycosylase